MSDEVKTLGTMDNDAIKWQQCAICGNQRQRIVRQSGRPDFAVCDVCHSAFVLEDGGKMRMMYGRIADNMPKTKAFALKQWQRYFDICAISAREREDNKREMLPAELQSTVENAIHGKFASNMDAYLSLEAEKSEILYNRVKKLDAPPRRLADTGELPDLDTLFNDN